MPAPSQFGIREINRKVAVLEKGLKKVEAALQSQYAETELLLRRVGALERKLADSSPKK